MRFFAPEIDIAESRRYFPSSNMNGSAENSASVEQGGCAGNVVSSSLTFFSPSVKSIEVLIVDDQPLNLRILKRKLQDLAKKLDIQINIVEAHDGVQAVEKFSEKSFNLVITDCEMPNKDGFEATQEIRRKDSKTPIVALTANTDKDIGSRCEQAGMNAYYAKVITLEQLEEMFNQFVFSRAKNPLVCDSKNDVAGNLLKPANVRRLSFGLG